MACCLTSVLAQIMACCLMAWCHQAGNKALSEPMLTQIYGIIGQEWVKCCKKKWPFFMIFLKNITWNIELPPVAVLVKCFCMDCPAGQGGPVLWACLWSICSSNRQHSPHTRHGWGPVLGQLDTTGMRWGPSRIPSLWGGGNLWIKNLVFI